MACSPDACSPEACSPESGPPRPDSSSPGPARPDTPGKPHPPCQYAELHCLSNFSFLRGASHAEELIRQAIALGYTALAITDECSLAGVVRAWDALQLAREDNPDLDFKLIIGSEFQLQDGPKLLLLASNREGYAQLSTLISRGRRRSPKGHYELCKEDLQNRLHDCLAILIPPRHLSQYPERQQALHTHLQWLQQHFASRAWLAIERLLLSNESQDLQHWQQAASQYGIPLLACGDVHMHQRQRRPLQDLLTAIRIKRPLSAAGYALFANGERHLRPLTTLQRLYQPAWLQASIDIAQRCRFSLEQLRYEYPEDLVPDGQTATTYLQQLTRQGMQQRWPEGTPTRVQRQIAHELKVIAELRYEHYFLTVYDIVRYAREHGILCQGRGSAANSAVCYCLGITAVDPSRVNMLFERFISKERGEPPDIDVDFDNQRREEVMQYIYRRYGRRRAALTATVISYRRKSALRDTANALGLRQDQIEALNQTLAWWDDTATDGIIPRTRLQEAGFDPDNPVIQRLLQRASELQGFPRHLSQHVGGFVIARDQLSRLVPLENAAMPERTIIQWDKNDLDSLGLLKIDCLALGMLAALQRSFNLLHQHYGTALDLADIPADDPEVWSMIQNADTIGVFQIESRAQMNMLPRLRPASYYDLVIQISIVRPGPIQGDMVHPYLKRRRGEEAIRYPDEAVKKVLQRTLGVPLFQEQIIELAMVAAGFSGGEADQLRRAIGSWRRSYQLEHFHQRLSDGMQQRGYSARFAEQLFNQIKGFGEYGFPESHAASFALIAWASSWMKHHYPDVFLCALLNSQPMGFYNASQLIQDARRHHIQVLPVDVCHSAWDSTLEGLQTVSSHTQKHTKHNARHAIRLGLHLIKGLSQQAATQLTQARQQAPFTDLNDLRKRSAINSKDLNALASADALKSLAGHRHHARWQAMEPAAEPTGLFSAPPIAQPTAIHLPTPDEADDIVHDYATLGLTLRRHPLALLRPRYDRQGLYSANQLTRLSAGRRIAVIGLVSNRQHPASAGGTLFLTLEDETGNINIIVWERTIQRFRQAVLRSRLLRVQGKLEREGQVIHIIAEHLEDHSQDLGRLLTRSRDFR